MQLGVTARTVSEVRGAGPHSAQNDVYRGLAYTRLVSGLKVEEAAPDCLCDPVVRLITLAARLDSEVPASSSSRRSTPRPSPDRRGRRGDRNTSLSGNGDRR